MRKELRYIAPFLFLAVLALLAGLWGGLLRLGWRLPTFSTHLAIQHGPLMISGFLGTLIALERVAALRQRWMFSAVVCSGLGWVISLALPESLAGPALITLGSLLTAAILAVIVRRETKIYTLTMAVGALCWLTGNLLWISGMPIPRLVGWWAAFLVLTIAGERLELSRVLRLSARQYILFGLAAGLFLTGVIVSTGLPQPGALIYGTGLVALAAWLIRYDLARRNLRHRLPLTRYIAVCLFTGYLWLLTAGFLNLVYGAQSAGPIYDAVLHVLFLGFVFSMIFGHAPIIFPALTGARVAFRPELYLPLVMLHASLALRLAGDLAGWAAVRQWSGIFNEVAIVAFIGVFAWTILRANKQAVHAGKITRPS
jgi:hypothetical protein